MSTSDQPRYLQALIEGGFTPNQVNIYAAIVRNGPLPASRAAQLANTPRTLSYKTLQELQNYGLIKKEDAPRKVALYSAVHPFKLSEIMNNRLEQSKAAKVAVDGVLGKIISDFNTRAGAPGLRVLEGISGMAEFYEDVLNERQTIKLIRSPKDRIHPELGIFIQKQIAQQIKLGMKTLAITPMEEGAPYDVVAHDEKNLTSRRIVPKEKLSIPAQVVIYANKVALTGYEPTIITTIIENSVIFQSFNMLFDYLWELAEPDDTRIRSTLK